MSQIQSKPPVMARTDGFGGAPIALLTVTLVAFVSFLSIFLLRAPDPVPATSPADVFASGRAVRHLQVIAREPHPIGSRDHDRVRDYLVGQIAALGVTPEIQRATSINPDLRPPYAVATVQNIVAHVPGRANTKALLIVGHYDSVLTGPGANDDGVAVAALLETLRALKTGAPPQNDVIFLFTDGEEAGLLGARAFVAENPLSHNIGVVFNFEARGSGGPSLMFETSPGNGWLVQEFARAAPYPFASSLFYEVYKYLPNATDFTIFKDAGIAGMNFAYIDGLTTYHSSIDTYANVDERSLQHHGSYALALARHFGNLNLSAPAGGDAVYFNLLGAAMAHYPDAWVLPLMILVALVWGVITVRGFRRRLLSIGGVIVGFFAFLGAVIAVGLVTNAAAPALGARHGEFALYGDTYNSRVYLLGFVALTVAFTAALYTLLSRRLRVYNLAVGAQIWWLLLAIAMSIALPGASYLFVWPLLFSALGTAAWFAPEALPTRRGGRVAALVAGALPAVLIFAPLTSLLFTALSMRLAGVATGAAVLLLGLLVPHLSLIARWRPLTLPALAAIAGLACITFASTDTVADTQNPQLNNVFYGLNADTGEAIWSTTNAQLDDWSRQFFSAGVDQDPLKAFFPLNQRLYTTSSAAPLALPAPQLTVLSDTSDGTARRLHIRVVSLREGQLLWVYADQQTQVLGSLVNGKALVPAVPPPADDSGVVPWGIAYWAPPPEGVELTLMLTAGSPAGVRVVDFTAGLPAQAISSFAPRQETMAVSPFVGLAGFSNATMVSRHVALGESTP